MTWPDMTFRKVRIGNNGIDKIVPELSCHKVFNLRGRIEIMLKNGGVLHFFPPFPLQSRKYKDG